MVYTHKCAAIPQYFVERTTEQNFEQSEIYFQSHFLNTYELHNFKKVAPGFFDDPFMNLYINPASIPDLGENSFLIYLDFRGDWTKVNIRDNYVIPLYTSSFNSPMIDWRWFTVTCAEPESIFSLGILSNPLKEIDKDFLIGGTYQLINRKEKFYSVPYGTYYPRYYYDNFGVHLDEAESIPISDRYLGQDDLSTIGHLFTAFAGYKINDELNVGLAFNGVLRSIEGGYANNFKGECVPSGDYN